MSLPAPLLPGETLTLSTDTRLEVSAIMPEIGTRTPVVEIRLQRLTGAGFVPTPAGFRIPLHLTGGLRDAIGRVAARAVEAVAWGASESGR